MIYLNHYKKKVLCHSDLLLIEQKKANKVFSAFFYFISFVYSVIYLGEKEQEEKRYLSRHESLGNHSAERERERQYHDYMRMRYNKKKQNQCL